MRVGRKISERYQECRFTDDNIVVNDFNTVLLFDKKGNFIRQIGRRGQGPGEYLWVHGTAVDGNNRKYI